MALLLLIALIFVIFPFFSIPLIIYQLFRSRRYRVFYGILLAFAVGIIVYHIVPTAEMDLSRYYSYLDELKQSSFSGGIAQIWSKSDPLSYSFMFIISYFSSNNFVPLVTALIGYGIYFYIIFDYSKIKELTTLTTGLAIMYFFAIYNIINSFTGIRFGLGISIFLLALYLDVVKKRRKISLILYIITPLIHSSTITLLLIRLIVRVFKDNSSWVQYALIFLIGFSTPLLKFVSDALSAIPFLEIVSTRAEFYLQPSFPSGFWYPFNIAITVATLVILLLLYKKEIGDKALLKLNIFILIVGLANVLNFYIATRYMTISKLLFTINLISIFAYLKDVDYFKGRRILLYICCVLYLAVTIVYLSYQYTALKYMDFNGLFPYGLMDNVFLLLS